MNIDKKKMNPYEKLPYDTYSVSVECSNCFVGAVRHFSLPYEVVIPKGTTVKEHLKKETCKFCGCKTLRVKK